MSSPNFGLLNKKFSHRVRSYNVIELLEKLTIDLENHYRDKLLSVSNGSFDGIFDGKFIRKGKDDNVDPENISVVDEANGTYSVISCNKSGEQLTYTVDSVSGFCTCPKGRNGRLCKHQFGVPKKVSFGKPKCNAYLQCYRPQALLLSS